MKSLIALTLVVLGSSSFFALSPNLNAHCQIPCGIYGDPARFAEIKEHITTVEKAMVQIKELTGKTDPQSVQQIVRWVQNKESHANNIQQIAQEYFLAQRIKPPKEGEDKAGYLAKLEMVHLIIVHSMKCKQTVDVQNAAKLKASVEKFQKAYEQK